MLGSDCCCGTPCGQNVNTVLYYRNGAWETHKKTYQYPKKAGTAALRIVSYYTTYGEYRVYPTKDPTKILVSAKIFGDYGARKYSFLKPSNVTSITVEFIPSSLNQLGVPHGNDNNQVDYSLECTSISCLQKKCNNQPDGYVDTVTVTVTVPSYKLTIPRLGKEYWYQKWQEYDRITGQYKEVIRPWALPLDVRLPKPMRYRYTEGFTGIVREAVSAIYYPWRDWIDEWNEDTFVRPDELPKDPEDGYFSGAWSSADALRLFRSFWGEWEYVGSYEFSAEYELDGSLWSGTYELQRVEGTEDTWIYYFPDGAPSCNEFYLTERQKQGVPLDNDYTYGSYIMLRGCRLSLGNLKAKVHYGLGEATGTCDLEDVTKNWIEDFNMNGYSPIGWDGSVGWYIAPFGTHATDFDVDCEEPPTRPLYLIDRSCFASNDEFRINPAAPPFMKTAINGNIPMECPGLTTTTTYISNYVGGGFERLLFIPLVGNVTGGGAGRGVGFNQSTIADKIFEATRKGLYQFVDPEWLTRTMNIESVYFDNGPGMPWFPEYTTFVVYNGEVGPGDVKLPGEPTYPFDPYYEESGKITWYGISGTATARCQVSVLAEIALHPNASPGCKWCWNSWYKDAGYWQEEWEGDLEVQIDSIKMNARLE